MSMYLSDETPAAALFGFDLLQIVSFRLWPHGFDLAVLPRWGLALAVSFTSQGRVVCGKVLGLGVFGELEEPRSQGKPLPFFEYRVEEDARYLWMGRLRLGLDRKSWKPGKSFPQKG